MNTSSKQIIFQHAQERGTITTYANGQRWVSWGGMAFDYVAAGPALKESIDKALRS